MIMGCQDDEDDCLNQTVYSRDAWQVPFAWLRTMGNANSVDIADTDNAVYPNDTRMILDRTVLPVQPGSNDSYYIGQWKPFLSGGLRVLRWVADECGKAVERGTQPERGNGIHLLCGKSYTSLRDKLDRMHIDLNVSAED